MVGGIARESSENHPAIDAHLMEADRAGTGFAGVIIGNERQGGRNIKGLANAHQGSCGEQFSIGLHMPRPPRHR